MPVTKRAAMRLPVRRLMVKDKFHLKKNWAFLNARNARCCMAAKLWPGAAACVFLDSPKLRTTRALLKAGIRPAKIFPINGKDHGGFVRKATALLVRPVVSMFHAAAARPPLSSRTDVRVCYNDGTHGDPDLVWRDMQPWVEGLPRAAYLSYTFSMRSKNAVPATASFGLLLMLASRGFQPPGGWRHLSKAVTFDGKMFNVQLLRGVTAAAATQSGLTLDNGYSLSTRYAVARTKERLRRRSPEDLVAAAKRLLLLSKRSHGGKDRVSRAWDVLRKDIARLGAQGEHSVLSKLPASSWIATQYRKWLDGPSLSKTLFRRFPKRRLLAEQQHWQQASGWLAGALEQLPKQDRGRRLLVVATGHPNFQQYLVWLRDTLPHEALARTLCVGEKGLSPAVKANVTRRRALPLRSEAVLEELRESRDPLLAPSTRFAVVLLPLFLAEHFDDVLQEVEKHVAHAAAASVLVVHLRTKATLSTLSWALWLIAHLADTHGYQLSRACHLPADGSGLLDYSRILTLVLSRGV